MQKKTDIEHGQLQTDQYKQIVWFDIKKKNFFANLTIVIL